MMSNSIAILSDAFNNLTDMGSSAISIISAKLSNRPPDKDHPFGHGRFEYLASLTIGMIILVVGYKLCETSIAKFFAPEPMEISYWSIGVLVLSIAVKGWMYCYNRYIGKKINSGVNEATAADSINDAIATTGVLVATIAQQFTTLPVDAAAGTLIGLMIIYAGYGIVREIVNILLGQAPDEQLVKEIVQMALQCDYVVGVHDIKIHDYGPGRMFGSLHAEIPDTAEFSRSPRGFRRTGRRNPGKFQIEFSIHMDPLCTTEGHHADAPLAGYVHPKGIPPVPYGQPPHHVGKGPPQHHLRPPYPAAGIHEEAHPRHTEAHFRSDEAVRRTIPHRPGPHPAGRTNKIIYKHTTKHDLSAFPYRQVVSFYDRIDFIVYASKPYILFPP